MIWQPPSLKVFTLSCDQPTTQRSHDGATPNTFTATGSGFDQEASQIMFVRADIADGTLKPFQVIPCWGLEVNDVNNAQEIKFKASLYERDAGPYHLVAWNPTGADGVNESAVLERAMTVLAEEQKPA
jgi:hypothetical protein